MTGVFALTFDTELIWGSFTHTTPLEFERRYPDVRGTIGAVLDLLERRDIPATWAIVGHLFLAKCDPDQDGVAHAGIVRPQQSERPGDWYVGDPCTDRARDPLWYGDDLVAAIRAARPRQEIACHSFGHARYGDPAMTAAAARSDLAACLEVAAASGNPISSFVFPRNSEGHHACLQEAGFRTYRGADPTWHARLPGRVGRAAHLIDQVLGLPPPISRPAERLPGLWTVPGSCLLMDASGIRRMASRAARIRKVRLGLRRAAETGGVFHLWTHPFNMASNRTFMLEVLDGVLQEAAEARAKGLVRIATMRDIPALYASVSRGGPTSRATES